jgi:hypothetical protein
MKIKQTNKLNAYQTLQAVLAEHQTVWQTLPAFVTAAGEFTATIPQIHTLAQTQASREGVANEKAYALDALGDAAFEVGAAIHAYAVVTQEFALEGRVDFSRSSIVMGRATSVLARTRDIHAAATEQLANLADYGVTTAMLTDLQNKITAFETVQTKPRQQVAKGSAATRSMEARFKTADTILNKRLDKLVVRFKTSAPDFYTAYQTARSIVDIPGSHKPAKAPATAPQPA